MEAAPTLPLGEFLRLYPLRAPHLMWFLGAGASASAGIPTAWDMIWEFKRSIYCTETHVSVARCANLSDNRLRRRIQQYFDEQAGGRFPAEDDPAEYAEFFLKAYPDESDRQRYISSAITRGGESFGQLCLAGLLRSNRAAIVWTTNFDHLLEDACAKVYGTTKTLTQANLDNTQVAISAINESRWPVLVKLHGDFRSNKLKNISKELESQDAQLRRSLVARCQSNGLVVAGYSGRDPSVMQALADALAASPSYPQGLFWLSRRGSPTLESVNKLLTSARAKGVQAAVVEIESFDELMAELITSDTGIDEATRRIVLPSRRYLSPHPMPSPEGGFPVVRTNALPVVSYPETCRLIDCTIGNTKDVRQAVADAKANVLAVRSTGGVLAFGPDAEVKRAFEPFGIKEFTIHSFARKHLDGPGTQRGLLYDAIVRALARNLPLRSTRRGSQHFLMVKGSQVTNPLLRPLVKAAGVLFGKIAPTPFSWAEGLAVRLESTPNQLWLVIEPTILGSRAEGEPTAADRQRRKDFIRARLATRYNRQWNGLLDAWIEVLSGGSKSWTVQAFGVGGGTDATFELSSTTGFSRRHYG